MNEKQVERKTAVQMVVCTCVTLVYYEEMTEAKPMLIFYTQYPYAQTFCTVT